MKIPDVGDDLSLSFYCKDPDSKQIDECATFYRTDRGSWIVQGDRRGDAVEAQLIALKDHETFLEISDALADRFARMYLKEKYGFDLGPGAEGPSSGRPS